MEARAESKKRKRHTFTEPQLEALEAAFAQDSSLKVVLGIVDSTDSACMPQGGRADELATTTGLTNVQISSWFQVREHGLRSVEIASSTADESFASPIAIATSQVRDRGPET
jgi:hypothetical protein